MAHISLPNEDQLPGIRGLMAYSPSTAQPMNALAEVLLRSPDHTLTQGERELIATYVSYLNDCWFCQNAHASAVRCYMDEDGAILAQVKQDFWQAHISEKLKTLLDIAASVQKGGKHVTAAQIEAAKTAGASDREIHDAVLIAAAFCMFNRYVDGLGTWAPANVEDYNASGIRIKNEGYAQFDPLKLLRRGE